VKLYLKLYLCAHWCTGGLHYIITHGGIDTEEDYPYVAHDAPCNRTKEAKCAFQVAPGCFDSAQGRLRNSLTRKM